jgi:hypothetical protein
MKVVMKACDDGNDFLDDRMMVKTAMAYEDDMGAQQAVR